MKLILPLIFLFALSSLVIAAESSSSLNWVTCGGLSSGICTTAKFQYVTAINQTTITLNTTNLTGVQTICDNAGLCYTLAQLNQSTPEPDLSNRLYVNGSNADSTIYLKNVDLGTQALTTTGILNIGALYDSGYASVSQYPPAQSDTYVKSTTKYSTSYWPYFATDPAKTLTGAYLNNAWIGAAAGVSRYNQSFHIDLGEGKVITKIYYENLHNSGADTAAGAKTFTFWGSNSASAFADTTYAVDTDWTQITTSQATFDQHVASNTADPKYISASNVNSYRYYRFKFADNWGNVAYMGVRRIELQSSGTATLSVNPNSRTLYDGNGNEIIDWGTTTSTANFFSNDVSISGGRIGIGVAPSTFSNAQSFGVSGTLTPASASSYLGKIIATVSTGPGSGYTAYALNTELNAQFTGGSVAYGGIVGGRNSVTLTGGAIYSMQGMFNRAIIGGSGSTTPALGANGGLTALYNQYGVAAGTTTANIGNTVLAGIRNQFSAYDSRPTQLSNTWIVGEYNYPDFRSFSYYNGNYAHVYMRNFFTDANTRGPLKAYGTYIEQFTTGNTTWGLYDEGNNWAMDGDNSKFYQGEGQNYSQWYDGTNQIYNASGDFYFTIPNGSLAKLHAAEYLTSTGQYDKDEGMAINQIKDSDIYNNLPKKIINGVEFEDHSIYGSCARDNIITDNSRPVSIKKVRYWCDNADHNNTIFVEEKDICPENFTKDSHSWIEINYPYKLTLPNASISMDCMRARYEQVLKEQLEAAMPITLSDNTTALNVDTVLAEQLLFKSITVSATEDYVSKFSNATNYFSKKTDPSYVHTILKNGTKIENLNAEKEIVDLKGYVLQNEYCRRNNKKWEDYNNCMDAKNGRKA